jgi:hypothetical protein
VTRKVWLAIPVLVLAATEPAIAQLRGPVLHEPVAYDPREDAALLLSGDGDMRSAIQTPRGLVPAPDPARPVEDTLVRLHDLVVARPGVSYVSISFDADGTFLQANFTKDKIIEVQVSRITPSGTQVHWYLVKGGALEPLREKTTDYDPRKRPFYALATQRKQRAWTPPYTFFLSHETGITCTEPVYDGDTLRAVLTVDFDINALSSYVARPALDGARSIVYAGDGVVLA